jgi:hypothetical protein
VKPSNLLVFYGSDGKLAMEAPIYPCYLKELLEEILKGRIELIRQFQSVVWDQSNEITGFAELDEKLRGLALDLDYFESDERIRAQGSNLYGYERLAQEIQEILHNLDRAMGFSSSKRDQ